MDAFLKQLSLSGISSSNEVFAKSAVCFRSECNCGYDDECINPDDCDCDCLDRDNCDCNCTED